LEKEGDGMRKGEGGGRRRTDFRSDFWRQMYRNQRFSSSWILEGIFNVLGGGFAREQGRGVIFC
jgi:hypothetical protein